MQSPMRVKQLAEEAKLAIEEHDAYRDTVRNHLVAIYENYRAMLDLIDRENVPLTLPGVEAKMQPVRKASRSRKKRGGKKKIDRREMFMGIIRDAGKALNSREVWAAAAASGAPSDAMNPSRVAEVTLRNLVAEGRLHLERPGYFAVTENA